MANKVLEDGTTWIDFRKLREIELGIAKSPTKAEQLIRTYSTGDSNHSSEEGSGTDSWTTSDTSDLGRRSRHQSKNRLDELDSQYGSLRIERQGRSSTRNKKPMNKRSLLHSFERPTRNIEAFVSQALGVSGSKQGSSSSDGGDSGLEFDYNSLPRRIKDIQIESDFDQEADEFVLQSSSASSIDKTISTGALGDKTSSTKRKKTKKARFKAEPVLNEKITPTTLTSASSGRIRSTSLDRSRLGGTRSISVFSMSGDYSSDCRSIDGISSEIFVHSDLNEYRGALVGGTRCKPKMRLDHLRGVMTRHDDMMRVFNRRQRETIRRVEHVFESSHRQIDTVLIDMKIDMATKKR